MERLNKFLAGTGLGSRRKADQWIAAGRVKVNGAIIRELGVQINPAIDRVELDHQVVGAKPALEYLILHKPPGYLTTVTDPFGRPTVMDLLPPHSKHLYPVGRLDLDTSGLLFFTNDGEMALALTHPRHLVEKVYQAVVKGIPSETKLRQLAEGIKLDDGMTAPAKVTVERIENGNAIVIIILREGRKRQVKRMLQAIGHPVTALQRRQMGPLILEEKLHPGQSRRPTSREMEALNQLKASFHST